MQLIADSIDHVYVTRRRTGASISCVDGRESPCNRRQRNAFGRPKAAKLSRHAPPSPSLPVEVDDRDCPDLSRARAESPDPGTRHTHGQTSPGAEREPLRWTYDLVEVHLKSADFSARQRPFMLRQLRPSLR